MFDPTNPPAPAPTIPAPRLFAVFFGCVNPPPRLFAVFLGCENPPPKLLAGGLGWLKPPMPELGFEFEILPKLLVGGLGCEDPKELDEDPKDCFG